MYTKHMQSHTAWLNNMKKIDPSSVVDLTWEIKSEDYLTTIKEMQQGAPGTDGLDANIIQALPKAAHSLIQGAMSDMLSKGAALLAWWKEA